MNGPVLLGGTTRRGHVACDLEPAQPPECVSIELMEALCQRAQWHGNSIRAASRHSARRWPGVLLRHGPAGSGRTRRRRAHRALDCADAGDLATSPLVTIAAVHGAAYAGGGGLMACCDFIVAAEDTKIGFPEVRRGLLSALITPVLRSRLRDGDLRELLLLGDPIDARRAMQMGLVGRVVPMERLLDEAKVIAATVLLGGPETVRRTRGSVRESGSPDISRHLARALELHQQGRRSDEAREGLDAFLEHRAGAGATFPLPPGEG